MKARQRSSEHARERQRGRQGDVPLARVRGADGLLEDLRPGHALLQPRLLLHVEPAKRHERLDELREALVPQGTTDDSLGLRNVVELPERNRVPVGVRDEGKSGGNVVRLGVTHEILSVNVELLP